MKLKASQSSIIKAQLPNGSQQTGRLEFNTYKITNDDDMFQFQEVMATDVQIVISIQTKDATYITVKQFKPTKIALE